MPQDPFKIRGITNRLPSMREVSTRYGKGPYIGVTQGGSSRTRGALIAATHGETFAYARAETPTNEDDDVQSET